MGQLHQILAVEPNIEGKAKRLIEETNTLFKKTERFNGHVKVLSMLDENRSFENTTERHELTTTVPARLNYTAEALIDWWDLIFQKDSTNQSAKADIVVDGQVLADDVPATTLLNYEKRLVELRSMVEQAPTLTPGINWVQDHAAGEGIWKTSYPTKRNRTEKVISFPIVAPATDKHPAQVKEVTADKPIGVWEDTFFSGAITPSRKAEILGRIDAVLIAVKEARQRANSAESVNRKIAAPIIHWILQTQ